MQFLRKPKPAPALPTVPFTIRWTPEPLPVGEIAPTDTLAALAAAARRDVWAGTRDTDRRG